MLHHVAIALNEAELEVLIVGRKSAVAGYAAVSDLPGFGGGPAVGLFTALSHDRANDVFLVAVDQPLLRPATVTAMLDIEGDAVVPIEQGHPQVTCALFRQACHDPLAEALATGQRKLRRLLDIVETAYVAEETWRAWGEDGSSWLSLDTPDAVRKAEALR
jgi:molybdopterin-guanine dinucleotide biosynthesis protein A